MAGAWPEDGEVQAMVITVLVVVVFVVALLVSYLCYYYLVRREPPKHAVAGREAEVEQQQVATRLSDMIAQQATLTLLEIAMELGDSSTSIISAVAVVRAGSGDVVFQAVFCSATAASVLASGFAIPKWLVLVGASILDGIDLIFGSGSAAMVLNISPRFSGGITKVRNRPFSGGEDANSSAKHYHYSLYALEAQKNMLDRAIKDYWLLVKLGLVEVPLAILGCYDLFVHGFAQREGSGASVVTASLLLSFLCIGVRVTSLLVINEKRIEMEEVCRLIEMAKHVHGDIVQSDMGKLVRRVSPRPRPSLSGAISMDGGGGSGSGGSSGGAGDDNDEYSEAKALSGDARSPSPPLARKSPRSSASSDVVQRRSSAESAVVPWHDDYFDDDREKSFVGENGASLSAKGKPDGAGDSAAEEAAAAAADRGGLPGGADSQTFSAGLENTLFSSIDLCASGDTCGDADGDSSLMDLTAAWKDGQHHSLSTRVPSTSYATTAALQHQQRRTTLHSQQTSDTFDCYGGTSPIGAGHDKMVPHVRSVSTAWGRLNTSMAGGPRRGLAPLDACEEGAEEEASPTGTAIADYDKPDIAAAASAVDEQLDRVRSVQHMVSKQPPARFLSRGMSASSATSAYSRAFSNAGSSIGGSMDHPPRRSAGSGSRSGGVMGWANRLWLRKNAKAASPRPGPMDVVPDAEQPAELEESWQYERDATEAPRMAKKQRKLLDIFGSPAPAAQIRRKVSRSNMAAIFIETFEKRVLHDSEEHDAMRLENLSIAAGSTGISSFFAHFLHAEMQKLHTLESERRMMRERALIQKHKREVRALKARIEELEWQLTLAHDSATRSSAGRKIRTPAEEAPARVADGREENSP